MMMRMPRALAATGLALLTVLLAGAVGCRGRDEAEVAVEQPLVPPPPPPLEPRTIPVLCMHDLGENVRNDYSLNMSDLEKYLDWLAGEGYETVTARDVAAYLNKEGDLPEKPIVLSFDDTWKSALTLAEPALSKHGYVGVAFVMSSSVGANENKLTWDDLKALAEAGWEVGSHSNTHQNLTKVEPGAAPDSIHDMVIDEVYSSREAIEKNTGLEVTSLALPYGNYDTFVLSAVRDAGYTAALSIDRGPADERSDPYLLPRTMVMRGTRFATFQAICRKQRLHIDDLSPPPGSRVTTETVTITGILADEDVASPPMGEVQQTRLDVTYDPTTRRITAEASLNRGANSIVLRTADREVSWLLIRDT